MPFVETLELKKFFEADKSAVEEIADGIVAVCEVVVRYSLATKKATSIIKAVVVES